MIPMYRMSDKDAREIEDGWDNDREAHTLLDLIDAEFQSDPMSVQCFDLRVVKRVRECVLKRQRYLKARPIAGLR